MKLFNTSIVTRIYLGFGFIGVMLAGFGIVSFVLISGVGDKLELIVQDANVVKSASSSINTQLLKSSRINTSLVSALSETKANQSYQQNQQIMTSLKAEIELLATHLELFSHQDRIQEDLSSVLNIISELEVLTNTNLKHKLEILQTEKTIEAGVATFLATSAALKREINQGARETAAHDIYIGDLLILVNDRFAMIELLLMNMLNTKDTHKMQDYLLKVRYYAKHINNDLNSMLAEVEALNVPSVTDHQKTFITQISSDSGVVKQHIENRIRINQLDQSLSLLLNKAEALDVNLKDIDGYADGLMNQAKQNGLSSVKVAQTTVLFTVPITLFIALLVSILLGRALKKPLEQVMYYLNTLTQGDYSQALTGQFQGEFSVLSQGLNALHSDTLNVLKELHFSAQSLAQVAASNSNAAIQAEQKIQQQSLEISSVATAVTQMEAAIREVAENTAQSSELATSGEQDVDEGQEVMSLNIETMEQLEGQIQGAGEVIEAVAKFSNDISSILDVINSISDKTNLLALNAAIEAARAGEHGRGFSVVADEVRSLASQTASSTQTIKEMIVRLQTESSSAVTAMSLSLEGVSSSKQQVTVAGDTMGQIRIKMHEIGGMADQISVAAQEQHHVAQEVTQNINVISSVAEENAHLINGVAKSGYELEQLAAKLKPIVQRFKLT